jgi:hypothetical protein
MNLLIHINPIYFTIVELYITYIVGDVNFFTNINYRFSFVIIIINIKKSSFFWNKFDKKIIEEFNLNFVGSATRCRCYYY